MIDFALGYAALGWPVFPVTPRGKTPLGVLVPHGHNDATLDPDTIKLWWSQYPTANIGTALPAIMAVLDVDNKPVEGKDGYESLKALEATHGALPETVHSLTGGGGVQYFFKADPALGLTCSSPINGDDAYKGLDLKTKGGYVVLPPSVHPSGRKYEWEVSHTPGLMEMAPLPKWIADARLAAKKAPPAAPTGEGEKIQAGARNQTMFKLAASLRTRGLSEEALLAALMKENEKRCDPPLPEREVRTIAHSAGRYEQGQVHTASTDFQGVKPTEPTQPSTNSRTPRLEITAATDLMQKDFPPLRQAVYQLICEGLTMLVAASKVGKSWLVLLMAICVARGEPFLGRVTSKCRVLYFALEDSERRLQGRLRTMQVTEVPDNLAFVTKAQMLDTGFLSQVENWLSAEEGPALVIIDTLQKVRGIAKRGTNAYEGDYDTVGGIKALADKYRAMIVCVHHTNKARNVTDIFDKVSGSTGIMGAADTTILIDRERGQDVATVHFEGRDAWGDDFVIRFDNGRWELVHNSAQDFQAGAAYENEPLVLLFRKLLAEKPEGGRWAYSKLLAIGLELLGYQPFIDGKDCARKLNDGLANELRIRDKIVVETAVQTTGGKGIRLQQINQIIAFPTKMQTDDTEPT